MYIVMLCVKCNEVESEKKLCLDCFKEIIARKKKESLEKLMIK